MILGKLPPPYMGPSIATEIILNSSLKDKFVLLHLDTRINANLSDFGKWSLGKLFRNLLLYIKMRRLLRFEKPDLVLIPISQTRTGFLKDAVFISLASLYGSKIVLQLRGSDFKNWMARSSGFMKNVVKRKLEKTHAMIVLGQNLRPLFSDYYRPENIFVVPNGGDYVFPKRVPHDDVRILYFSNLLVAKGVEDVLHAAGMLRTGKKFSLDLVGAWYDASERARCLKLVEETKATIRIHPPAGGVEKMQFFANADVFVFPPREPEGHPWAIVEAMAAGLPIVSTNQGAIIESVIDQKNGFIVEPAQPAQIAEKLRMLVADDALREKMGAESRNLYLLNFTEEKMVERLENVFNTVLKQ